MGYYINHTIGSTGYIPMGPSFIEKVSALQANGAKIVSGDEFVDNLVCIIDNGWMAAALYCYDEREYMVTRDPDDYRPKVYLQYEHAKTVAK